MRNESNWSHSVGIVVRRAALCCELMSYSVRPTGWPTGFWRGKFLPLCQRCCYGASDSKVTALPEYSRIVPGADAQTDSAEREAAIVEATMQTTPRMRRSGAYARWRRRKGSVRRRCSESGRSTNCSRIESRSFKFSNDPEFARKVRDIVGLYMNPPDKAMVLSVDEKSQIQALDRTQPSLPLRPGLRSGRRTIINGTVQPRCSPRSMCWKEP